MNHSSDSDELLFRLDPLYLCRSCGRVYGTLRHKQPCSSCRELSQQCDCRVASDQPRWPDYDFNEAVTLCRCCGCRALPSGLRRSPWFCSTCRRAVRVINSVCRGPAIPEGRFSLYEQIGCDEDDERESLAFVERLGDWFDRVEQLETHARQVVRRNLAFVGDGDGAADVRLDRYLQAACATPEFTRARVVDLSRAFDVPPFLVHDALRTIAAARSPSIEFERS